MDHIDKEKFGDRVRASRKALKKIQVDIQVACDVNQAIVSSWENGHSLPQIQKLIPLCETLHVSADYLLGLTSKDDVDATTYAAYNALSGALDARAIKNLLDICSDTQYMFQAAALNEILLSFNEPDSDFLFEVNNYLSISNDASLRLRRGSKVVKPKEYDMAYYGAVPINSNYAKTVVLDRIHSILDRIKKNAVAAGHGIFGVGNYAK